jgi:hypothetical protein
VAIHPQKLTHKSLALAKDIAGNETKSAIIQRKNNCKALCASRERLWPAMLSDISTINYDQHEAPVLPHP